MLPVQYTEAVGLGDVPASTQHTCVTYCDNVAHNHALSGLRLHPALSPTSFSSSLIVYDDCTRKRHVTKVFYEPRYRTTRYDEGYVLRPRNVEQSYVSFVEQTPAGSRRWYRTAVELKPKTFTSSKSHNVEEIRNHIFENQNIEGHSSGPRRFLYTGEKFELHPRNTSDIQNKHRGVIKVNKVLNEAERGQDFHPACREESPIFSALITPPTSPIPISISVTSSSRNLPPPHHINNHPNDAFPIRSGPFIYGCPREEWEAKGRKPAGVGVVGVPPWRSSPDKKQSTRADSEHTNINDNDSGWMSRNGHTRMTPDNERQPWNWDDQCVSPIR